MQFWEQSERQMTHSVKALGILFAMFAAALSSRAQTLPEPPLPVDPRPLAQLISEFEKATLAEARDPRKLIDAYLRISDTHLQVAFNAIKGDNHVTAQHK